MTENKPKPLDLEGLTDEIIRVEYPTYELTSILQMKNAIIRKKQTIEQIIKHRIKQACEFFLRYLSMPHRFKEEQWNNLTEEEREKLDDFLRVIDTTDIPDDIECEIHNYNRWLFKLAFKGVFDDEKKES